MKFVWILVLFVLCFGATSAFGQYYVVPAPPPVYYVQPAPVYVQPVQPTYYAYPSYPTYYYPSYGYPIGSYGYGYGLYGNRPRFVPGEPIRNFFHSF